MAGVFSQSVCLASALPQGKGEMSQTNGRHTARPGRPRKPPGQRHPRCPAPPRGKSRGRVCAGNMRRAHVHYPFPSSRAPNIMMAAAGLLARPGSPRLLTARRPTTGAGAACNGSHAGSPAPHGGTPPRGAAARGHTATGLCGIPTRFPFNRAAAHSRARREPMPSDCKVTKVSAGATHWNLFGNFGQGNTIGKGDGKQI